ncbi:MAG TPA: hypothetical protein VNL39_13405 [Xanthobacteraceae bacterium]|nr:hypothetical protein [Xanthobacteraceae bacterium]
MQFHLVLALIVGVLTGLAGCSDYKLENRPEIMFYGRGGERVHVSPYPMSRPAADIWKSDACWRRCEVRCAAAFDHCAEGGDVEACRSELDGCSRSCVANCRRSGGPLVQGFE